MKKLNKVLILFLVLGGLFVAGPVQQGRDFSVPVSKYVFRVEIDGVDAGYFKSVGGLSIEQGVVEYQESDAPLVRKRPGRVKYGDITLRRGYMIGTSLNNWIEESRDGRSGRKNMSIILTDHTPPWEKGVEIKRWNCYGCFPRWWSLSELNNESNNKLTEEMVIAVEWFEEKEPTTYMP
jgi:phage tail-like protein